MSPSLAPFIEMAGIYTRLGGQTVHEDLNLAVMRGEILGIVGGSGAGKTTLLRQLLGLERPTRGTIKFLGGHPPLDSEQRMYWRRRSGVVFQRGALFSALSVVDNVGLALRELKSYDADFIRETALHLLDMVGIGTEHADKFPSELSGGMVKRVALARALALEPEILFLDEPTAGLDPAASKSIVALIEELHREFCLTVVMVTHDLDTLVALCDRVAVLADRKIIVAAPIDEVIATPHPFIQSYFLGERGRVAPGQLRSANPSPCFNGSTSPWTIAPTPLRPAYSLSY
jgi:phospholipid/cholesterol/gamma-HCH transport system ATP-binding protein